MTTTRNASPARRWMHVQANRNPNIAGALAAWLATSPGGWGETVQAWNNLTDLMPLPHEPGYTRWSALNEDDLYAVAAERGIHFHPDRDA